MSPVVWAVGWALAVFVVLLTVFALRRGDRAVRWVLDDMETDDFLDELAKVRRGAIIRASVAPERVPPPARLRLVGEQ